MKKVSVIIPVYNAGKYLRETLNCVAGQSYDNLEIICVLDAPTDDSAKIAEEFAKADSRVKIIRHPKNMGLPAARNTGAAAATGEYIHFMDADDLISPGFYKNMTQTDADAAACNVFYEKKPRRSVIFGKNEIISGADKMKKSRVLKRGWAWRWLIRRDFWHGRRLFFPDLVPMEDKPAMIRMVYYAEKIALCPNAVYFYRNRDDSILRKKLSAWQKKIRHDKRRAARKDIRDFLRENKITTGFGEFLSRAILRVRIFFAVAAQRTIGRLLAGGVKKPNIKGKILPRYFAREYLPAIRGMAPKMTYAEEPETIWQFWDNPPGRTTPEIVKSSLATIEKFRGSFEQKILDKSSAADYSDLPGFIYDRLNNGQMRFAHFADLLRLNLLKNHGGFWMDATIYMTAEIPKYISDRDFFVFLTGSLTHCPYSFMQNFFIRAKKGAFLNDAWHDLCIEFWKNNSSEIDYFQHQLLFREMVENNPAARDLFEKMPHVSEDETLQFVDSLFSKFDAAEWERIKKTSFMQKLAYRKNRHDVGDPAEYPDTFFEKLSRGLK
jgi:glycosyltransferase involved in cell wall biosynthesis